MKAGTRHLVAAGELEINRVENKARRSMGDVEGIVARPGHGQFWIELKTTHRPKRTTTPIRVKFQDGQSYWLDKRWGMGGNAWLLVQVGKGHQAKRYLVPGCNAPIVEEGVTEDKLFGLSICLTECPAFEEIVLEASVSRSTSRERRG